MSENSMRVVYDTIIACRNDSGKLAKEAFLRAQESNLILQEFLRVCYEQKVNLFMKKIRFDLLNEDDVSAEVRFTFELLNTIVDSLSNRRKRGNAAKSWIANIHASLQEPWEKELLELLIARDVKAGFSESTINKVWPGLVTDVPYMRCCLPKDAKLKNWNWSNGVYSQIKADGMFENVDHHEDGTVTMMSRAGTPMPLDFFADIVAEVKAKVPRGYRLNGELLMLKDGVVLPRQIGNGHFNSIVNEGELDARDENLVPIYDAWDMIPLSEAKPKNKYKVRYEDRFAKLTKCLDEAQFVKPIEYKIVYSIQEAYDHYKYALERGLEGTVIKHPDAIWEDTTSKFQVKLKLEAECEMEITEFTPGNGKNAKLFGSVMLKSKCGQVIAKCGSGIDDKLRKEMNAIKDQLIGKIITVKSNFLTPPSGNKTTHSLFLPIFIEIRYDKNEADDLDKIKAQFEAAIKAVTDIV
jgi:DNA ligase-1